MRNDLDLAGRWPDTPMKLEACASRVSDPDRAGRDSSERPTARDRPIRRVSEDLLSIS
jgi:hypothetical protein